jgi:predicted metal-binding membrane protein
MDMTNAGAWQIHDAVLVFTMWAVMMVVMMAPSAVPLARMYMRSGHTNASQIALAPALVGGYLTVWIGFSLAATILQATFHNAGLLVASGEQVAPRVGGVLLLIAGAWQFTPQKHACLTHCRSPLDFLVTHWRAGARGAFGMGAEHGLWCAGCCWALMLVLFVVGVMNTVWVAMLAAWVLLEKILPHGKWLSRVGGAVALVWGVLLLASSP